MIQYNDFAIPLAWPDQTAFGDEKWMTLLKKWGIVKNLNFKVGHAAILLVSADTGAIDYYDFGRYIAPRGDGRARSKLFDPRLHIHTTALFGDRRQPIRNLDTILSELTALEEATHGGGRLLFSVVPGISYLSAKLFADQLVQKGPIPYGALAAGNNSCSRFVAQVLIAGMLPQDRRIRKLKYPETLKPSPVSNIVNTRNDGEIYCYANQKLKKWKINRLRSLHFHWQMLKVNFSGKYTTMLACDNGEGHLDQPDRPDNLTARAQWIGGLGEGMWFEVSTDDVQKAHHYLIRSYTRSGILIGQVYVECPQGSFDMYLPYEITAQMDGQYFTLLQQGTKYLFKQKNKHIQHTLKAI